MDKTLVMRFVDAELKKVSMSLTDIKDDLTSVEIETLMDAIIANQEAFELKNALVSKDSANIVGRTVTEVYKA
ncbi:DUF2922 domain-containing protein [Clostridium cochlearium]|uniref:DUF2922 domain-containing protein n=1 Tax=Clostridium cochlearium TaxID=1494 RepID=UPI000BBB8AF0|nr:DUF2922 domain-containing protein [Clostridium cochlearium]